MAFTFRKVTQPADLMLLKILTVVTLVETTSCLLLGLAVFPVTAAISTKPHGAVSLASWLPTCVRSVKFLGTNAEKYGQNPHGASATLVRRRPLTSPREVCVTRYSL